MSLAMLRISSCFNRYLFSKAARTIVPTLVNRQSSNIGSDGIVRCPFPDVPIPEKNLFNFVFDKFGQFSKNVALVDATSGREVTYEQFQDETSRVSSGLSRMGFGKGDVLAVVSPNSLEYPSLFFATLALGGVVSTCNSSYTANELSYQFKNSGAKFVATVPSLLATVRSAAEKAGVEKIIVVDQSDQNGVDLVPYTSLLQDSGSRFKVVDVNSKEDIAVLPYSSGTTGLPKGVMLTHYNLIANICQIKHPEFSNMKPSSVLLGLLPFFHIYGMVVILFGGFFEGAKIAVTPRFEPDLFLATIEKHRPTIGYLVPPLLLFLAKHPDVPKYDLSSLHEILSGAAPIGGDIVTDVKNRVGVEFIRQGYGLTETSPVTNVNPKSTCANKPKSVGPPVLNQEMKVINPVTGEALGIGEEGEVMMWGPNIMKGYLNQREATEAAITDDGWFHSGDIGYYDKDGHFFITDRLKELIKVKGLQVAPAELEALLQNHPEITDAAVIGLPHERLGEAPKAFVVRKNTTLTETDVENFVKEKVSEHKWLAGGVEFIEQVPKSASGKILRRTLKDQELKT